MTRLRRALSVLAGAAMAGCAVQPPKVPSSAAVAATREAASPGSTGALVLRLQSRARDAESDQRWAEAVTQWEVLVLLRPEDRSHREALESARRAAREAVAAHWKTAEAARSRRSMDAALHAYLKVLATAPRHVGAAAALKTLETERTTKAWLNRPPRGGYTPPGTGEEPPEKR